MKQLSDNWLTEGLLDFEYKKYLLLAYLKYVKKEFGDNKLYPCLEDLVRHYATLTSFRKNRDQIESQFSKKVNGIDWGRLELLYTRLETPDSSELEELNALVDYAIPQIKVELEQGKGRYEWIENQLELEPIGVRLMYQKEGYLLVNVSGHPFLELYRYQASVFTQVSEKYREVRLTLLDRVRKRIGQSLENIKLDLIRRYKDLPNPAVFSLGASMPFPIEDTLLPVGKRMLMATIAA